MILGQQDSNLCRTWAADMNCARFGSAAVAATVEGRYTGDNIAHNPTTMGPEPFPSFQRDIFTQSDKIMHGAAAPAGIGAVLLALGLGVATAAVIVYTAME